MRIRSIKPEFWRSPDTAQLSYFARLLFVGLWNYVDDSGVGDYDEALIRSDLFPRDPVDEVSVRIHAALVELYRSDQVTVYQDQKTGRQYLKIVNWHHQVINRPTKSKKPQPTSEDMVLIDLSVNAHMYLIEDSPLEQGNKGTREQGTEGAGERGSAEGGHPPAVPGTAPAKAGASKQNRGKRIPEGWMPSDSAIETIRGEFPDVTSEQLAAEHRKFHDYWLAQPGAKGVKVDWEATWRNWMRRAGEQGGFGGSQPRSKVDEKVKGWMEMGENL